MQADIISFAYRGFSNSDGQVPYEAGIRRDIAAINSYFKQVIDKEGGPDKVSTLIWGKSFGSCTTITACLHQPKLFGKVILESPLTTFQEFYRMSNFSRCHGRLYASLSSMGWDNPTGIRNIDKPLLIVSGTNDPITPITMAR